MGRGTDQAKRRKQMYPLEKFSRSNFGTP
ncbi:hypothetical protein Gohar_027051 [Gossypium harknessii]|uniref:Uncharacterized protein n=1 Tax=Gossypium harknessii TaxID=34285 RepID=A0A7J9HU80_9ROSI|nr:hypothetical protein [Gossypium harknessii]